MVKTEKGQFIIKYSSKAPYNEWISTEYKILKLLNNYPFPTPKPIICLDQMASNTSNIWLVMESLPGITLGSRLKNEKDKAIRQKLIMDFGKKLKIIHNQKPPNVFNSNNSWIDNKLEKAEYYLSNYKVDGSKKLLQYLYENKPIKRENTLIHGDYTLDNVLVSNNEISGIIDWGGCDIGDPRYDLAIATSKEGVDSRCKDDINAFYRGYGDYRLTKNDREYFLGLYEFF